MSNDHTNAREEFARLIEIVQQLRAPGGCPWDREQTHRSLRPYLVEETYEVLDSIDREAYGELKKELGDLMLHIVFHAQIAGEEQLFDMADVLQHINEKLIRRHPHVFGDSSVTDARHVERQWEKIKLEEGHRKRLLEGVPKHQPALNRAFRVQEKAAGVGFDWPDVAPVWDKIREEVNELEVEVSANDPRRIEDELGDLLFSIVNLARKLKVNPEDALRGTVDKFTERFNFIEDTLLNQGRKLHESTLEEMDSLWDEAKRSMRP